MKWTDTLELKIEIRRMNMDDSFYWDEEGLLKYAVRHPGGRWTATFVDGSFNGSGPLLIAYGKKHYTFDDMKALDKKLQAQRAAALPV